MKRILSIQDLTCLGKCALTVALPLLSAMGVETAVLPTTILSVHTAFPRFRSHDLGTQMADIAAHFREEGFCFDALYTGYLGEASRVDEVLSLLPHVTQEDSLIFVDPVMGDEGVLYEGLQSALVEQTRVLCGRAQIITPNLTEACLLLGRSYPREAVDLGYYREILKALHGLGPRHCVITGVPFPDGSLGAMSYDAATDTVAAMAHPKVARRFHGTGDVFSSVCLGALLRGRSVEEAMALALDTTYESILCTERDPDARWYSVHFEEAIPRLVALLQDPAALPLHVKRAMF